jgi:hypothetical protein
VVTRLVTGPQLEARLRLAQAECALLRDRLALVERDYAVRLNGHRPTMVVGRAVAAFVHALAGRGLVRVEAGRMVWTGVMEGGVK